MRCASPTRHETLRAESVLLWVGLGLMAAFVGMVLGALASVLLLGGDFLSGIS
jgi:hypothetical protein